MKLQLFIGLLFLTIVSSCGHFHDAPKVSVWASGLWLVPTLIGAGAVICWIAAIIGSRSGSHHQSQALGDGGKDINDAGNVGITKTPFFPWALGLTIIEILVIIYVNLTN